MQYKRYLLSRDMAWKILLEQNISELPVRVSEICRNMGIPVRSYRTGNEVIELLNLKEWAKTAGGFAAMVRGRPFIFYDEHLDTQRNRFTIAHEMGHIVLGHLPVRIESAAIIRDMAGQGTDELEQEANVFAGGLLAPDCVLRGIGARCADDIGRICDIGPQAAELRWRQMQLLDSREKSIEKGRNGDDFYASPLEAEVFGRFSAFIQENRL